MKTAFRIIDTIIWVSFITFMIIHLRHIHQ